VRERLRENAVLNINELERARERLRIREREREREINNLTNISKILKRLCLHLLFYKAVVLFILTRHRPIQILFFYSRNTLFTSVLKNCILGRDYPGACTISFLQLK
jgi:hypothetical protein